MIHFDTNFLVQATKSGSPAHNTSKRWSSGGEIFNISSIVWAEFLCGPLDADDELLAREIFPSPEGFLSSDAELAAKLFNETGRRSRSLADCMIAAVVIRCGAKLATVNIADFQPFVSHGLTLAQ
ncbi:MAG TPA: type II toxin-antitoxin system VapC family toxin [Verrucomicrobiae bacterium]|jgi:predicted nucleic acid-binding protein|nr:type II toxin-antitoxin system VapC family toxin [Verrucomicrobiae bacterium]